MTNSEPEKTDGDAEGIADDQLPEDLRPSEDNPLAEPLENRDDAHSVDDLDMQGGKTPEESERRDDSGNDDDTAEAGSGS